MTAPKMLTLEELDKLKTAYEKRFLYLFPSEFFQLLATARAALKVVEAAKRSIEHGTSVDLYESLRPFQQTGEDK